MSVVVEGRVEDGVKRYYYHYYYYIMDGCMIVEKRDIVLERSLSHICGKVDMNATKLRRYSTVDADMQRLHN